MLKQMNAKAQWVSNPIDLPLDLPTSSGVMGERAIAGQVNGQVEPHWMSNLIDVPLDLRNSFGEGESESTKTC